MAEDTHLMQAPKGMRDFYPAEMAVRRHIEDAWRRVSVRCGFDEIEGPTFEHLALYTKKSGEGIVSELFRVEHRGDAELALRPEFTPTLARLVAARAASLPQPIKWFAIPLHYRAERPQRGRLREFIQWNVDFVGHPGTAEATAADRTVLAAADVEVIGCMIALFEELGLSDQTIRIKISHRHVVANLLRSLGLETEEALAAAFALLDRRDKITPEEFTAAATKMGLGAEQVERFDAFARVHVRADAPWSDVAGMLEMDEADLAELHGLRDELERAALLGWCDFDLGIVRGLAYYTGVVFEAHEASGAERAVAGGGRYDNLIELFGGPSLPACGFGMGDVVLGLVLEDQGLMPEAESLMPRPDAFVISSGRDDADAQMMTVMSMLRRAGLHARRTYKATRNIGKLLKEAGRSRARFAVIAEGGDQIGLKDLASGEQESVALGDLVDRIATR
jgi:histidyl-tRNA synthetase